MQRYDSMTRKLDVEVQQNPGMPNGFVGAASTVELPTLPSPATGAQFQSPAFTPGGPIPARFTCDGQGVSPPLEWTDGAAEYAVVVVDLDAGGFTHWIITNIIAGRTGLPEGASGTPSFNEGTNSFGKQGWGGPCPPTGRTHRYQFTLLRFPKPVGITGDVTLSELYRMALESGATAQSFIGTYTR
jgi:hypothetical protein